MTTTASNAPGAHPLDMLTADEVKRAVETLNGSGRLPDGARYIHVVLHEPTKDAVAAHTPGDPVDREVALQLVAGSALEVIEVIVSVTAGEVREYRVVEGVRPTLLFGESYDAITEVRAHPEWQAAMRKRGITDFDLVQIDP